ncbi:hypothetical protein [Algirhabdus cladophorae]|uniref:hypothetical protein n=1 Tax=Algirhabdus cladophorae TaxID=3377108 RepID=UPI003B84B416
MTETIPLNRTQRLFLTAGVLMLINAGLHILAPLVSGFGSDALMLIPVGVLYGLFGWGLMRGWRWLAYIVFLICLIGGVYAYMIASATSVPAWWMGLIVAADVLVIVTLFLLLWRRPTPAAL